MNYTIKINKLLKFIRRKHQSNPMLKHRPYSNIAFKSTTKQKTIVIPPGQLLNLTTNKMPGKAKFQVKDSDCDEFAVIA